MTKFVYAGLTFETDQTIHADDFTEQGMIRVQTTDGARYSFATGPGIPAVIVELDPPRGRGAGF